MRLIISDHALIRWHERVGPVNYKKIRRLVMGKLHTQLRIGLRACDREGFELEIFPDLRAVLAIDPSGCWVVETFFRIDLSEQEEREEQKL